MSRMTIREMRESIDAEKIKMILQHFDVDVHYENNQYMVFPTVCHNLDPEEASKKLFFYKNTSLFKCYTECNAFFDIFELIQKMFKLRGEPKTLAEVFKMTGFTSEEFQSYREQTVEDTTRYFEKIMKEEDKTENDELVPLRPSVLRMYSQDKGLLKIWEDEGIGIQTLLKYEIKFDIQQDAIVIPHFDEKGNIVGVRGRFLRPDAYAKYRPLNQFGNLLSHPVSKTLYGLHQNLEEIKNKGIVVIFEAEKSVLKMDTIYGESSVGVAVCGKNISETHIELLLDAGVHTVVIAFDSDYLNYEEALEKEKEYVKIGQKLTKYFNVSIIMDYNLLVDYKDSPIDKGQDIFKKLMRERKQI